MQTRKKSARRGLLVSATSLLLSVAMLVGTTFAWFTDSVSSGTNTIKAGNLDIEVEYSKDGTGWSNLENTSSLFGNDKWEPGHTEFVYLKVKNAGSLDLNYKVMVSPVSENGGISVETNTTFKLSDYLVFGTTIPDVQCPNFGTDEVGRTAARDAIHESVQGLNQENLTKSGSLESNEEKYLALVVYMPETVGNEANAKPGTTPPSINLGIKVIATQMEAEQDSFDETYDRDAVNAPEYFAGAYYDYFEAVNVTATADNNGKFTVTKTGGASGIIASASGMATTGTTVNLVVTKTSVPTGNFGITVAEGHELNGYDIKVSGQTEGTLVQGKLYVGTGLENFKFYHDGNLMVEVQYVNNLSLTDNQYSYNPADGYVYFATSTFSPFQATYKAPVAAIGTAVYGTVQDAINAAPVNATSATVITILKDVKGGAAFGYPDSTANAGRNVTIDFAGHSYEFKTPGMGSTGTENQAMHLIHGNTMTLKNGTISVSNESTEIKRMIQNYCELTLEDMIVDCTNVESNYNNSMCRGSLTVTGNTNLIASSAASIIFDVDGSYCDKNNCDVNVTFDDAYTGTTSGKIEYVASANEHTSALTIKAGTFTGNITSSGATKPSISGGTFITNPAEFVDQTRYGIISDSNSFTVTEKWTTDGDTSWYGDGTATEYTISSAAQLAGFANLVSDGNSFSGKTVKLNNNIDLAGKLWVPIGMKVTEVGSSQPTATSKSFKGTFDGQNHTISNMRIDQWYATNGKDSTMYGLGLFTNMSGTLKNLTVENALVKATDGSPMKGNIFGIVAGYSYGTVTYENVHVVNSNLATGDVCAFGKVGGILGMAADPGGTTTFTNCSVKNTTIAGVYNCAPFVGLAQNTVEMTDCSTENVNWKAGDSESRYLAIDDLAGDGSSKVSGTYWNYNDHYIYAAWSAYYNDYANWVSGGLDQDVTHNGQSYNYDGYCHNTLPAE